MNILIINMNTVIRSVRPTHLIRSFSKKSNDFSQTNTPFEFKHYLKIGVLTVGMPSLLYSVLSGDVNHIMKHPEYGIVIITLLI